MLTSMKKLAAIAAVALVSAPALAVPTTWTYSGVCTQGNCSTIPSITGSLTADPGQAWPSDQINDFFFWDDVVSYSFQIGSYSISGDGSTASGAYNLDAAGNIVGGSMSFDGGWFKLDFLDVGAGFWSFIDADLNPFNRDPQASGTGNYAKAGSTNVPEPTILSMLGLSLLGFGFARRRKA